MDADVYGPSVPKMMNLKGPVQLNKRKILFAPLRFRSITQPVFTSVSCVQMYMP